MARFSPRQFNKLQAKNNSRAEMPIDAASIPRYGEWTNAYGEVEEVKPHKYGAKKIEIDGVVFDSLAEGDYYETVMKPWYEKHLIRELLFQPRFELQGAFTDRNGKKHRKTEYVGDFSFYDIANPDTLVVVDVKGFETPDFKLKRKFLLYKFPEIDFRVVKHTPDRRKGRR